MTDTVTLNLARYAQATSLAAIPADVRERAKLVLMDEMACAQFGRRSMGGDLAARYAMTLGGREESSILGTSWRAPAQFAALANGSAGHGEEVDGAHVIGGHPGATLVHACVAVAQRQRSTGAELINALVLGYDVGIRMVEACGGKFSLKGRSHLYPDFLYAVGAAVASGRLLGLDALRTCHAMALVTFQTNGLAALYQEKRHVSKSLCNGQFAFAGVSAALMSAAGLEGVEDVIAMRDGLLDAWGVDGGAAAATRALGQDFSIMGANFKFFNAGYPIHACVEASTTLVAEQGIDPSTIDSIHVGMPENAMKVVNGREMHNICVQDMVCAALTRGRLSIRELPFPAVLDEPLFRHLRARVTVGVDPGINRDDPDGRGANVTVTAAGRPAVSKRVNHPRGHSLRGGASWEDLAGKWHDGLPHCDVDRMISLARGMEDLEDVGALAACFTQAP